MKYLTNKIYPLVVLVNLVLLVSCNDKISDNKRLLSEAQIVSENNPIKALSLLDSIENPDLMDTDSYMKYIITRTQAKFKNKQDITKDTLIVDAVNYFRNHKNKEQLLLAYFYTGNMYSQQNKADKALEYYLYATNLAKENDDILLEARSIYNIGYQYYYNNLIDSAIVYNKKVLHVLDKHIENDDLKIQAMYYIGASYYISNEIKEAKEILTKAELLLQNNNINNKHLKNNILHLLGLIDRSDGKYLEASKKFHSVLKENQSISDSLRTYLSLSRLYMIDDHIDSVQYYNDIIKNELQKVQDQRVLRGIYKSFANYYKLVNNQEKAMYYFDLQTQINAEISKKNRTIELLQMDKGVTLSIYHQKVKEEKLWCIYVCIIVLILFLITYGYTRYKLSKRIKELNNQIESIKKKRI